jgi:hypothetical protein
MWADCADSCGYWLSEYLPCGTNTVRFSTLKLSIWVTRNITNLAIEFSAAFQ